MCHTPALSLSTHGILTTTPGRRSYYCVHFTDNKTKAQNSDLFKVTQVGSDRGRIQTQPASRVQALQRSATPLQEKGIRITKWMTERGVGDGVGSGLQLELNFPHIFRPLPR